MPYAPDYLGHDTPKLGFGLMRLPHLEDGSIDVPQVCDMVDCFLDAGLTYFDTAYVYTVLRRPHARRWWSVTRAVATPSAARPTHGWATPRLTR